ncbi:MAG: cyclic nucleotide-binding domain-containing protein [Thermodesulfobacteriota bacterium]|nr:cyclic nucleotide-binding domain-containing protein [Thermodesulfobacteriota bacterium]
MDRAFRILSGIILIGVGIFYNGEFLTTSFEIFSIVLGSYSLITGIINFCPLTYLISSEKRLLRKLSKKESILEVNKVKDLKFFENFKDNEILKILSVCRVVTFEKDRKAITEGDHKKKLYIIYSGQVKVVKAIDDKETKTINTLEDGDVFGEMSFFDNLPPSASVIAVHKTQTLEIDIMDFFKTIGEEKDLAIKVLTKILQEESGKIRALNQEIASMGKWLVSSRKQSPRS